MARIIARLISWLAGKAVVYVLILAVLLGVFVVKVVPPMVVKYHEKELENAIAELGESRALVGELAERAKRIGGEITQRSKELRELAEKGRTMEKWLEKVMKIFRKDEIETEKKRIEAKERRLRSEIGSFANDRMQLRIEGGETEEELKRRELLRDEKEKELREIKEMCAAFDSLMRNEFRQLALKALLILVALILIPFLWKIFAYYGGALKVDGVWVQHPQAVMVLPTDDERHALVDDPRVFVPAYLGPYGWIGFDLDKGSDWTEVHELIEDSHRLTAPKRCLNGLDQ